MTCRYEPVVHSNSKKKNVARKVHTKSSTIYSNNSSTSTSSNSISNFRNKNEVINSSERTAPAAVRSLVRRAGAINSIMYQYTAVGIRTSMIPCRQID